MFKRILPLTLLATLLCTSTTLVAQTLEQKAAKMLIVGVNGTTLANANQKIVDDIQNKGVSGVIFFEHNITPVSPEGPNNSKQTLKQFITDLKALRQEKLFVTIDQEGGLVNRLKTKYGFAAMPSHKEVGQKGSIEYANQVAATIATEVASVGFNVNFAPCVDVDINPLCPVIGKVKRSFSADPMKVAEFAAAYINQHHKQNLLTSLKHFPGHGNSILDSHHGFTDISSTWQQKELVPYKELVEQGLCDMIMVSHLFNKNIDPEYPATLSKTTIDSLLRKGLGYDGVVISDDMQMKAISDNYEFEQAITLGVNAGIDLFIIGGNIKKENYDIAQRFIDTIVEGVASGKIDIETIDKAVQRIERLRQKID